MGSDHWAKQATVIFQPDVSLSCDRSTPGCAVFLKGVQTGEVVANFYLVELTRSAQDAEPSAT